MPVPPWETPSNTPPPPLSPPAADAAAPLLLILSLSAQILSLRVTYVSFPRRLLASSNLKGVDIGTVSVGVVGNFGSGIKTIVGRRRRKMWWGGWGVGDTP